MQNIIIDAELWNSRMLPEGILERWFVADEARVAAGARIAEVRIEGGLHEIMAPAAGFLKIRAQRNALIEPGSVVAELRTVDGVGLSGVSAYETELGY